MSNKKPKKCCCPDCFNCPYEDCKWDGMSAEDYLDTTIDKINHLVPREVQMARNRANRYARKNRERIKKASLEWYYAHREEQIEKSKKWNHENKDRVAAAKRKRWAENPEYYRQKQREYRAKKKLVD